MLVGFCGEIVPPRPVKFTGHSGSSSSVEPEEICFTIYSKNAMEFIDRSGTFFNLDK